MKLNPGAYIGAIIVSFLGAALGVISDNFIIFLACVVLGGHYGGKIGKFTWDKIFHEKRNS
ncbi:MAG: hypothetical protein QF907_08465 [Nitrospinota bacterium]|jgi:hypothetical protein|nr:hypothetical protein [Nitrospinota bacterium]MDP7350989.1 hypothetical protein [Nitrospinota bacterium]MDP7580247.1 hypothetical protein [Nitrospinota bacterium]HJN02979.1 hypothetical protein [Nitrospinota bacterium]